MFSRRPQKQSFDIQPDENARFVPRDFYDIIVRRYLPVVSLTYIASIIGIAWRIDGWGGFLHYLFEDSFAYNTALWMAVFVSIPALFWIFIRVSVRFSDYADIWYKGMAGLLCLTLIISLVLFPEWNMVTGLRLRMFMVASIPMFFVQYWFFVRGGLPGSVAWPLTIIASVLLIYGLVIV
ncbi:hypothetical protein [Micavibrio aeruginosavorus]|uniref:Putative membrane protein n=1 Tax=Micavibrio aeruginosavorus (strain ARL-13) TaxID=856793 RepID=G2KRU9_MICAA|nr:hypothetical protein [Micavibrio aeruginosavorus]AEP10057.1 putative membrane protein [Micavibrio aeruginosavorus ARL-13]